MHFLKIDFPTYSQNYFLNLGKSYQPNTIMITHLEPDILECEVKWALWRKHHYEQS